ncbi:F-box domain-containing protein [Mycena sanguinolenta]|uniref:F-box domain-containing protein n=1 Tax=Mycena sanguinolenta TaxID=230812 RepID=A0A8H6XTA5_9AGAR|nr:F-box domain-containing protein [Mycena sanguinolenta]
MPLQQPNSPVHTIPCEITAEIFVHCLPTSYGWEWNIASQREAPMLLSHVCRDWREIALCMPALWTNMEFSVDNTHSHEIVRVYLLRTKGWPLSVKLRWPYRKLFGEDTWSLPVLQALLERAHHLEFLELRNVPFDCIRELDQLSESSNFPSLQKLTIDIDQDVLEWDSMEDMPCVRLFANAPVLREIYLIDYTPPAFLGSLPWHQLTKYEGSGVYLDHCADAMRLGSNLIECGLLADKVVQNHGLTLIHPGLKSLSLYEDLSAPCNSTDILRFLSLPALETLQILNAFYESFSDPEFLAFLTRSSPPLRKFTAEVNRLMDDDEDAVNVIGVDVSAFFSMPSLIELEMWHTHEKFISPFFSHCNNVTFLPQIQHLSFFHPRYLSCDAQHDSPDHVRDLSRRAARRVLNIVQAGLSARWNARHHGVASLKSFRLLWDGDIGDLPDDVLVPFRTMASEGLNISIKSSTRSYIL